jgi:paraquat-inducible protein B
MMIGGFVVIVLFILVASLAVFGFGKFFKKTNKYVLYFDESVKGLSMGAPVLFQGVSVGSVTSTLLSEPTFLRERHISRLSSKSSRIDSRWAKTRKRTEIPGKLRISSSKRACGPR